MNGHNLPEEHPTEGAEVSGETFLIKYGGIISISHFEDSNSYIYSDGFVKTNILLKNFLAQSKKNYCFNRSLFLITPVFPNNVKTEAIQFLKEKRLATETHITQLSSNMTSTEEITATEIEETEESLDTQNSVRRTKTNVTDTGNNIFSKMRNKSKNSEGSYRGGNEGNSEGSNSDSKSHEDIEEEKDSKLEIDETKNLITKNSEQGLISKNPKKKLQFDIEEGISEGEKVPKKNSFESKLLEKKKTYSKKLKMTRGSKVFKNDGNKVGNEILKKNTTIIEEFGAIDEIVNKVKTEYRYNVDLFEKMKKLPVLYKQPFQLIHLASNKFLACLDIEAEYERESLRLQLEEFSSDFTTFQFVPAFKYQNFSDQTIFSGQTVKIVHMNQRLHKFSFFHCSEELSLIRKTNEAKKTMGLEEEGRNLNSGQENSKTAVIMQSASPNSITEQKQIINKREVNASFDDATLWKITEFSSGSQEKDNRFLNCGDIVWFHHSEMSGLLTAKKEKDVTEELEGMQEADPQQKDIRVKVIHSEIKDSFESFSGNTYGTWLIENEDFRVGGLVYFGSSYRLQHLSTGLYLAVIADSLALIKRAQSLEFENSTLFEFYPLKNSGDFVEKEIKIGSFIYIRHPGSNKWLDVRIASDQKFDKGQGLDNNKEIKKDPSHSSYQRNDIEPYLKNYLSEEEAFRVFEARQREVWEINFLISCYPLIMTFYENLIHFQSFRGGKDELRIIKLEKKLEDCLQCIRNLDLFCRNKLGVTDLEDKYSHKINFTRQNVLREQYYIDIISSILREALPKSELEEFTKLKRGTFIKQETLNAFKFFKNANLALERPSLTPKRKKGQKQTKMLRDFDFARYMELINKKIALCEQLYELLHTICRGNSQNELYCFELINNFQLHTKYLNSAITCITHIIKENERILNNISKDIRFEFAPLYEELENSTNSDQTINVIINITNKQNEEGITRDFVAQELSKHHRRNKLTMKPLNLIRYFFNLIWDSRAKRNPYLLRFLGSLCEFKGQGVSVNQEILYKFLDLYLKLQEAVLLDMNVEGIDSNQVLRIRFHDPDYSRKFEFNIEDLFDPKKIENMDNHLFDSICKHRIKRYTKEQLKFYTKANLGRNHLWKRKLEKSFPKEYLFTKAWSPEIPESIRSLFLQLSMSLYIDHEPFSKQLIPNLCRVVNTDPNVTDEKGNYDNSEGFEFSVELNPVIHIRKERDLYDRLFTNCISYIGKVANNDISKNKLNDELLLSALQLISLMLKLGIIGILDSNYVKMNELIKHFICLFEYDYLNPKIEQLLKRSRVFTVDKKRKGDNNTKEFFKNIIKQQLGPFLEPKKKIKRKDTNEARTEDPNLYLHPIMRSFVQLAIGIYRINKDLDNKYELIERKIKLEILEIFEYLLDMRQDSFITLAVDSFLVFAKKFYEQKSSPEEKTKEIEQYTRAVLPEIFLTGIDGIDYPEDRNLTPPDNSKLNIETLKNKTFPDLNHFFFLRENEKKIIELSILPSLMLSLFTGHDIEIEMRILKIIMRLFNQRAELKANLENLEIIFDNTETLVFNFIFNELRIMKGFVEKSEIWISNFTSNYNNPRKNDEAIVKKMIEIFKNMTKFFLEDSTVSDSSQEIIFNGSENISVERQNLAFHIKIHEPIISLIKDGIHHLFDIILDRKYETMCKDYLLVMFSEAYKTLRYFCTDNRRNQFELYRYLHILDKYLHYDCGQISLICAIFHHNKDLLLKVDQDLLNKFLKLIENEGRQALFLDFFLEIQKSGEEEYFIDNQLLCLNSFLPSNTEWKERTVKLLYLDHSNKNDNRFYFDEFLDEDEVGDTLLNDGRNKTKIIRRLELLNFKDSYRDEPFDYHIKLINMLMLITKSNELSSIAISKIKSAFRATYFLEILCEIDLLNDQDYVPIEEKSTKSIMNINEEENKDDLDVNFLVEPKTGKKSVKFQSSNSPRKSTMMPTSVPNVPKNLPPLKHSSTMKSNSLIRKVTSTSKPVDSQRKGYSHLKPIILKVLINVHFKTDFRNIRDMIIYSRNVANFINFESRRVEDLAIDSLTKGYSVYFLRILNFMILYKEKFLYGMVEKANDEEGREDSTAFLEFIKILKIKNEQLLKGLTKWVNEGELRDCFIKLGVVEINPGETISTNEKKDFKKIVVENENETKTGSSSPTKRSVITVTEPIKSFLKSKTKIEPKERIKFDTLWKIFKKDFLESPSYKEAIEAEKKRISDSIVYFDKFIDPSVKKDEEEQFDMDIVVIKFIKFIEFSVGDEGSKTTIINLLDILKRVIDNNSSPKEKEKIQNFFNNLDAMNMILNVIANNQRLDSEIFSRLLSFGISMLEGGNKKVQKNIYEFFMSNQKSELVFQKFNSVIRSHIAVIENVKRQMEFEEDLGGKKNYVTMKSTENEKNKDPKIIARILMIMENSESENLQKVLRFLQLWTEGHYIDLQVYMTKQSNSRNNFDILNGVVDLLKTYYYRSCCVGMYENILKCLDTLIEFVQGPCAQNQVAVTDSKFFDIVNDLFRGELHQEEEELESAETEEIGEESRNKLINNQNKKNSIGNQLEDLLQWQISRLQHKCLILIMGLLEKRDLKNDTFIMKRIIKALPLETLEKKMMSTYQNFYELYEDGELTSKSLNHHETPIKKEPSKREELEYKTIIEIGFYLYFLIFNCNETKITSKKITMIEALDKKRLKTNKNLFGDNILSQLTLFSTNLFRELFNQAKKLKKMVEKCKKKKSKVNSETNVYHKMLTLGDQKIAEKNRKEQEFEKNLEEAYSFFHRNSAHIEVIRDDEVEQVPFILPPYSKSLPDEEKKRFNENVDRESTQSKIVQLVEAKKKLIKISKHEERLNEICNKSKIFSLFAKNVKLWKNLSFFLNLFLNLIILLSFSERNGDRLEGSKLFLHESYSAEETKRTFWVLGWIMATCSLFVIVFFLLKKTPLVFSRAMKKDKISKKLHKRKIFRLLSSIYFAIKFVAYLLTEIEILYYVTYTVLAIIGTVVHPFFFAFHLTEALLRYQTLRNVIYSVYEPRWQLGLTFILLLIFVYIFTLVGYTFFYHYYNDKCDSLIFCLTTTYDQTYKNNGGVGGWFPMQNPDNFDYGRFFFDNILNFILVIIMINILSGIIIDNFSSLRDKDNEKNRDIKDVCFICGLHRQIFDRKADNKSSGFLNHIKIDHFMWNYIFFLAYLKDKSPTEYTGIESYINEKFLAHDLSWFPFGRAIELKNPTQDESSKEFEFFRNLDNNIDNMRRNIRKINSLLEKK